MVTLIPCAFPQRTRSTEPFFNFAPQQAGPLQIRPGEPFVMRYRFVVMDGPPDAALLDAMWQAYALPPRVREIFGIPWTAAWKSPWIERSSGAGSSASVGRLIAEKAWA